MSPPPSFADLVRRARRGDDDAIQELVQAYLPEVRRIARVRLHAVNLRRLFDSSDVCQSVFFRFLIGMKAGQFDLASPEELVGLLVRMATNKVLDLNRRERARRRGGDRPPPAGGEAAAAVIDPAPAPDELAAMREARQAIRARLTPEESFLVEQRDQGRDWPEIAAALGESPEALRKRLTRGLNRAARELNLL
jgi:RNA polymerase sigma-70 factor (ECF subfamily)